MHLPHIGVYLKIMYIDIHTFVYQNIDNNYRSLHIYEQFLNAQAAAKTWISSVALSRDLRWRKFAWSHQILQMKSLHKTWKSPPKSFHKSIGNHHPNYIFVRTFHDGGVEPQLQCEIWHVAIWVITYRSPCYIMCGYQDIRRPPWRSCKRVFLFTLSCTLPITPKPAPNPPPGQVLSTNASARDILQKWTGKLSVGHCPATHAHEKMT